MDVVTVSASIAGILGLAGQSMNGIIQLRGFFLDVASASRTIERFLQDINSLLRVLHDVECLFSQLSASEFDGTPSTNSASLQVELEDCRRDVVEWLKIARDLRPASNRGRKSWFKKFWIGVNHASVNNIRVELERHRRAIQLNLAVIGRCLSVAASFKLSKISEQVGQVQALSMSLDAVLAQQRNAIDRIESCSLTSLRSSNNSLQSLGSIANSLSRLETAISTDTCSCLPNDNLRSVRSRTSLDQLIRKPSDDISPGSSKKSAREDCCQPRTEAPENVGILPTKPTSIANIKISQSPCEDLKLPHGQALSCQLCGQPWSSSTLNEAGEHCLSAVTSHHRSYRSIASMCLDPVAELDTCDVCGEEFSNEMNLVEVSCPAQDVTMGLPTSISIQDPGCDHISGSDIWMKAAKKLTEKLPQVPGPSTSNANLENQYVALMKIIEETHPSAVGEYILWRGMMTMYESQLKIISSTVGRDEIWEQSRDNASAKKSTSVQQRQTLEASQRHNEKLLQKFRSQCIRDGHSLYEIDRILYLPASTTGADASQKHEDMLEIRKKTLDSNLLHTWTNTRDRINSWLLHSLRSDDKLAQVHRSMLADQMISQKDWARLTLKHWTLDEAATGIPWTPSQSVAATDSKNDSLSTESLDFWTCDESIESQDGAPMNGKLTSMKEELQMLKRHHQKKLYHRIEPSSGDAAVTVFR